MISWFIEAHETRFCCSWMTKSPDFCVFSATQLAAEIFIPDMFEEEINNILLGKHKADRQLWSWREGDGPWRW